MLGIHYENVFLKPIAMYKEWATIKKMSVEKKHSSQVLFSTIVYRWRTCWELPFRNKNPHPCDKNRNKKPNYTLIRLFKVSWYTC